MTITANDVANMALDLLTEAPMTDYTSETTPEALWFQRNFETSRDAEFEEHPWRFAMTRVSLTVNVTAPAFGWSYRYALPSDFMRIGYLNYDGIFENPTIPHEIEGADEADEVTAPRGWLLCDVSSSIKLVYVRQRTEAEDWASLFVEALAAKMALKLSHWLTGKQSMTQVAALAYSDALKRAKRANALLSTPERPYDNDVIAARYASGSNWSPL